MLHSLHLDAACLQKDCDGSHAHFHERSSNGAAGEKRAEDQHYPQLFCQRLAQMAARGLGVKPHSKQIQAADQAAAGTQPRRRSGQRVPEFSRTPTFSSCSPRDLRQLKAAFDSLFGFFRGEALSENCRLLDERIEEGGTGSSVTVGVPWSEGQFIEQAVKAGHPADDPVELPQHVADAILNLSLIHI